MYPVDVKGKYHTVEFAENKEEYGIVYDYLEDELKNVNCSYHKPHHSNLIKMVFSVI